MKTKVATYTVRNASGQLMGRYRSTSAENAIRQFKGEQLVTASAFRKSHDARHILNGTFTASIEEQGS